MDGFNLTLLGFSANTYPILVELASEALGRPPANLRVRVILNLPIEETVQSFAKPKNWPNPEFCPLEEWLHMDDASVIMPGVMHEPAVSSVWESVRRAKPDFAPERLSKIIHPSAVIAPSVKIGSGTWIHPNVTVSSMSEVGFCCNLNRNSSLGHHNFLGDFSRLNPGAHTAGFCSIGSRTTLGIGSACIEKVTVGSDCVVGAGAVVISDGANGQLAVGVPAKWRFRNNLPQRLRSDL